MNLVTHTLISLAATMSIAGIASAADQPHPQSKFGRLDHVFLIMMENQTNTDILGNRNAPFINQYAAQVNQATQYFAVGHPSAPNYLEIVGDSNFGLAGDYWPILQGFGTTRSIRTVTTGTGGNMPFLSTNRKGTVTARNRALQ